MYVHNASEIVEFASPANALLIIVIYFYYFNKTWLLRILIIEPRVKNIHLNMVNKNRVHSKSVSVKVTGIFDLTEEDLYGFNYIFW